MYGLARLRGIGGAVVLAGRKFPVRARTLADYAEIEARMLELRGNPFDVLRWLCRDAGNRSVVSRLVDRLRTNEDDWWSVTIGESLEWLSTLEGRIFGLWLAVRQQSPEISLEWVRDRFIEAAETANAQGEFGAELWWDGIQTVLDVANGDDELAALENFGIEETKGKSGNPNWRLAFRDLCISNRDNAEFIGLSPDQFWNLTLVQYRVLIRSREALANKPFDRESLMLAHNERQAKATEIAVEKLTEGKRWNSR